MVPTAFHWIGTGSGLNPLLGNTSFMVYTSASSALLVDCGATVPLKLVEMDRLSAVTDILITHHHSDHIGGMEALAFFHYYVLKRRGDARLNLHVASDEFAHRLWENSLKGGMEPSQDEKAVAFKATMDTYFKVHVNKTVDIRGLPMVDFIPTLHVRGMENYALRFENGVFYSGDTIELPPHDPRIIFQDCQFSGGSEGDVHVTYDRLATELPDQVREKTHLVHLGEGYEQRKPLQDGFAGFVMPNRRYIL
ncbi:MAG: MBL fold metallo-hydrolase [Candidatus Hydrogenedentes bacterium]|nr:MBL fold metallo-hydrolase [Candidatus Hydrogenedentota bacterium]